MKTLSNLLSTLIMLFILSFTLPVIWRETKAFFYWKYVELRGGYVMLADGRPEVVIPPLFHADTEPIVFHPKTSIPATDSLQIIPEPQITVSGASNPIKLYWPPMY